MEAALSATAERLSPGSGAETVRHLKNELSMVDGSSGDLMRRYANEEVRVAAPAVFESKAADSDPVTIRKKREGLIVVFADSFLYVRAMGFGAREVKALESKDVTVEPVATVLDGVEVPGLRVKGSLGRAKFALAVALAESPVDAAESAAVRDTLVELLSG